MFSLFIAMIFAVSYVQAQNPTMTKAQALGIESDATELPQKIVNTSAREVLLDEGFDTDWLPDGWTVVNTHAENNWMQNNPSQNPFSDIDPESLFSALVPWIGEDQDEWLISPEIDAGGETPLNLTWYAGLSGAYLDPGATLICHISTDGGTTWLVLWDAIDEIDPSAPWAWNMVSHNLDAYAATPFKLAWQYVGNDGDLCAVDGVMLKSGYDFLYQSDFEDYETGEFVAEADETGFWTTWDNAPGSETDGPIVEDQAASPVKSFEVAGNTDLVFKMGNKKTGKYQFDFNMYVPATNVGYYNFQHFEIPGQEWAFDVFFSAAEGEGNAFMVSCADTIYFSVSHDAWFKVSNVIDLNNDMAELYIDDIFINDWTFSCQSFEPDGTLQLGGVDFWAGGPEDGPPLYYIDDVDFIELIPAIQEPVMVVTGDNPIFVALGQWEETTENITVGNDGAADLEYEIVVTYPDATKAPVQPIVDNNTTNTKLNKEKPMVDPDYTPSTVNPSGEREVVLNYDGDNFTAIGNSVDYEYEVAAQFPSDMLMPYIGMKIQKVEIFVNDPPLETKLRIWGMGDYSTGVPGALLYDQAFTAIAGEWNTIILDEPFFIDGQNLSVGYWLSGIGGTFVPGCDEGPADPNGDWFAPNAAAWGHLAGVGLDYNWNIRAYVDGNTIPQWLSVSPSSGSIGQDQEETIDVVINTANLNPEPYMGKIFVRGNDEENPEDIIDVFVDVSVGVNEFGEKEYIMVYPNPAKDVLSVSSNGDLQHVRLMNSVGQVVFDELLNTAKTQINVSNFEAGIYIIQIETNVGSTTHKIIIK